MTVLERITALLERARIAGGFIDEDVARAILSELGLTDEGEPIDGDLGSRPAASELDED